MGNWTDFDGTLLITPPLTENQVEEANSAMDILYQKVELSLQNSDASLTSYHEPRDGCGGFIISDDGRKVILNMEDRLYEGKRFLKYLIEHGIKPQGSVLNGEMAFLNKFGCFGILGVDNNEVYTKQYLKYILLNEFLGLNQGEQYSVKDAPKTIDDNRFIPTIYRYDIAKKITRNTKFEGSFDVIRIKNMEFYLRTKGTYMEMYIQQQLERPSFKNLEKEELEREVKNIKRSLLNGEEIPIIAEHNSDGTVGDISETNEWVLLFDNKKLQWSGRPFIAAHHWLAYLTYNAIDCTGSVKWTNEFNEQGNLIVESFENRNVVYIEYRGTKYLANLSWSY